MKFSLEAHINPPVWIYVHIRAVKFMFFFMVINEVNWAKNDRVRAICVEEVKILEIMKSRWVAII